MCSPRHTYIPRGTLSLQLPPLPSTATQGGNGWLDATKRFLSSLGIKAHFELLDARISKLVEAVTLGLQTVEVEQNEEVRPTNLSFPSPRISSSHDRPPPDPGPARGAAR